MEKHNVSRLSYLFAHLHLLSSHSFSSLIFSSLTLPISAFPSVHIVGSLTSKLPSTILLYSSLTHSLGKRERERERDRQTMTNMSLYIYIYIHAGHWHVYSRSSSTATMSLKSRLLPDYCTLEDHGSGPKLGCPRKLKARASQNILTKWSPTLMLSLKDRKVNWAPVIPGRSRETTNQLGQDQPPTLMAEESLHLWIDVHCLVIFQPATRQQCCRVTSLSYWSNGRDLRTSENLRPLIAFYDPKKASLSYGNWESPRIFPT